jgi:hypothetical protein
MIHGIYQHTVIPSFRQIARDNSRGTNARHQTAAIQKARFPVWSRACSISLAGNKTLRDQRGKNQWVNERGEWANELFPSAAPVAAWRPHGKANHWSQGDRILCERSIGWGERFSELRSRQPSDCLEKLHPDCWHPCFICHYHQDECAKSSAILGHWHFLIHLQRKSFRTGWFLRFYSFIGFAMPLDFSYFLFRCISNGKGCSVQAFSGRIVWWMAHVRQTDLLPDHSGYSEIVISDPSPFPHGQAKGSIIKSLIRRHHSQLFLRYIQIRFQDRSFQTLKEMSFGEITNQIGHLQ